MHAVCGLLASHKYVRDFESLFGYLIFQLFFLRFLDSLLFAQIVIYPFRRHDIQILAFYCFWQMFPRRDFLHWVSSNLGQIQPSLPGTHHSGGKKKNDNLRGIKLWKTSSSILFPPDWECGLLFTRLLQNWKVRDRTRAN